MSEITDLKKQLERISEEMKSGGNARLDPDHYSNDVKELVFAMNNVLDTISEKAIFYQSILDSLSAPVSVTDLDENWTFINKKTEEMINVRREDVLGMHCNAWGASICGTEQCAIKRLRRGELESVFEHDDGHYKALASYVRKPNGDVIGHAVTVVDITDLVMITEYMKEATHSLVKLIGSNPFPMKVLRNKNPQKPRDTLNEVISEIRDVKKPLEPPEHILVRMESGEKPN